MIHWLCTVSWRCTIILWTFLRRHKTIKFHIRKWIVRATGITKVPTLSCKVHNATLDALTIRISKACWACTSTKIGNTILNGSAYVILAAIGTLIFMRTSTIFTRVVTVFAVHQQVILMIEYIVSEIRTLIFGVAYVLVHLKFLTRWPLTFYALSLHLRATFSASIATALSGKKQGLAVI